VGNRSIDRCGHGFLLLTPASAEPARAASVCRPDDGAYFTAARIDLTARRADGWVELRPRDVGGLAAFVRLRAAELSKGVVPSVQ
jgi:hypothetical protein